MPEQFLAIADADKIHEYVFSPRELRLIKGGSFLQTRLNKKTLPDGLSQDACISMNGGTVVAKFPTRDAADEFCRSAHRAFRKATATATVSTATAGYCDGQWESAKKELDNKLEERKYSRPMKWFAGGSPVWKVCEACGLFPATRLYHTPEEKRWICQTCEMRRRSSLEPPDWLRNLPSADTFEDIAAEARPENYLAFVYIDLDRLGKYMGDHGKTEQRWRALSRDVENAIIQSVTAGCQAIEKPCQVLLAGGDDAIVALPADCLFAFMRAFDASFGRQRFLDAKPSSYSAGAILANSHYPIFEFQRLAEELLHSAKLIEAEENSIDFAVLTASMTDSIIGEREAMAARTLGPRRSARPYTVSSFLQLETKARELKSEGVPGNKIKALYPMVFEGRLQADLDYLYLLSRLESRHRDALRRAVGPQLWIPGQKGIETTIAADLVEMWDFVK